MSIKDGQASALDLDAIERDAVVSGCLPDKAGTLALVAEVRTLREALAAAEAQRDEAREAVEALRSMDVESSAAACERLVMAGLLTAEQAIGAADVIRERDEARAALAAAPGNRADARFLPMYGATTGDEYALDTTIGGLVRKHPDGQWVTCRKATEAEVKQGEALAGEAERGSGSSERLTPEREALIRGSVTPGWEVDLLHELDALRRERDEARATLLAESHTRRVTADALHSLREREGWDKAALVAERDEARAALAITFESKAYLDLIDERDVALRERDEALAAALRQRAIVLREIAAMVEAYRNEHPSIDTLKSTGSPAQREQAAFARGARGGERSALHSVLCRLRAMAAEAEAEKGAGAK